MDTMDSKLSEPLVRAREKRAEEEAAQQAQPEQAGRAILAQHIREASLLE